MKQMRQKSSTATATTSVGSLRGLPGRSGGASSSQRLHHAVDTPEQGGGSRDEPAGRNGRRRISSGDKSAAMELDHGRLRDNAAALGRNGSGMGTRGGSQRESFAFL